MKKQIAEILLASALLGGSMGAPSTGTRKRIADKSPLTVKQKKRRVANKVARRSRKINRK